MARPWLAPVRNAMPLGVLVTLVLMLPALGVALVKPCVVGTTARASKENVRSIGYSIYYTLVNIGGAAGPYIASWVHQHMRVENVFRVAALSVFAMFFAVLLLFKEPRRSGEMQTASLAQSAKNFLDRYLQPAVHAVSADFFRILGGVLAGVHHSAALHSRLHRPKANTELMLVTGPLTVIALQLLVSFLTQRMPAFRAITLGTLISGLAWLILIAHPTVPMAVLTLFAVSMGEITQSPRYYEYISRLAPPGQQGTYMGFAFLPIGIGSLIGGWFGGKLIHHFGEVTHQPGRIWWAVTGSRRCDRRVSVDLRQDAEARISCKPIKRRTLHSNERPPRLTTSGSSSQPIRPKPWPLFRIVVCPWIFPPYKPRCASATSTPGFFTITIIAIPLPTACLGLPADHDGHAALVLSDSGQGEPTKLVHKIEPGHLDSLPGSKRKYSGWQELFDQVKAIARRIIATSPCNIRRTIWSFTVSLVDAGTIDLIRGLGKNVVSSCDLVAQFEATLTDEQIKSHFAARDAIDAITAAAFQEIGRRVRNGGTHEYEMQQWILEAFRRENLVTDDPPCRRRQRQQRQPALRAASRRIQNQFARAISSCSMSGARKTRRGPYTTTSPGRVLWASLLPIACGKSST